MVIVAIVLMVLAGSVSEVCGQRLPLRAYSSADGLAGDHVTALLPDSRGFLWIGTTTGLSRFDGREFRNFGVGDGLPHPAVNALLEDRDGVIWVGTRGGLVRIEPQGREMSPVRLGDSTSHNVLHLIQTHDGKVWASDRHDLYVFPSERDLRSAARITVVPPTTPPPSSPVAQTYDIEALVEGQRGEIWIGTTWGLVRRLADGRMIPIAVRPAAQDDRIYNLAVDREGRVWITHWGIAHRPGVHFGVYVLAPESAGAESLGADSPGAPAAVAISAPPRPRPPQPQPPPLHARARLLADAHDPSSLALPTHPGEAIYMTAGGPLGDARVQQVFPAADGTIWIATEDGVLGVAHGRTTRYGERNGLGLPVRVVATDARGNVWLGTRGMGLIRLEMDGFVTYAARDGFPTGEIGSIREEAGGLLCLTGTDAANGQQWFATFDRERERLARFLPRGTEHLQYWGWGWHQVFLQDHTGEWWVPTGEGLFRYPASASCASIAHTPPTAIYTHRDGLPADEIFRLFEDSRGDLWMSVGPSTVRWVRQTGTFERVSDRVNPPAAFAEDRAGNIWIGFYRGGIARWRAGELRVFETGDDVPAGFIQTLFVDSRGRLWIGADPGGLAYIYDPTAETPRIERPPPRDPALTTFAVVSVI
jgi:ligand-binding sensor domain-containing protein